MENNKVNELMGTTIEKIKTMVDVNTAMGDPIKLDNGVTIIPVNRVGYSFGTGGSDIPSKHATGLFGGGAGASVTVTPTAFVVVTGSDVKVIQVEPFVSSVDRAIQNVPDIVDKLSSLFTKNKGSDEKAQESTDATANADNEEKQDA